MSNIRTTRDAVHHALPFIQGKVLDAGGGPTAKYRSIIQTKAKEYICLDAQAGGYVDVVGDVLNMPFQNDEFDTVVCNQVLEHVPGPVKLIHETWRVLKPGGHLICTAPFLEPVHADPGDYFRYTKQGMEALCVEQGFTIIEARPYGGFFSVMYSFIRFSWFNPYKKSSKNQRRVSRALEKVAAFLDKFTPPGIIYSDTLIIAQKK